MHLTRFSFVILLAIGLTSGSQAQGNAGICESASARTRVSLQSLKKDESRFYYRLENHVVYLDRQELERYFEAGPTPNRTMAQTIASYGALSEHTDVFQLFLESYSAWHELQYMLASALQTGRLAITRRGGEPLSEIYVERYTTRSCTTGRKFVEPDNDLIYTVIDSEA